MIEKIDIEKLGEVIIDWKEGKPWTSCYSAEKASKEVAEKLNHVIEALNKLEK